jgi:hypothetical protein
MNFSVSRWYVTVKSALATRIMDGFASRHKRERDYNGRRFSTSAKKRLNL